MVICNNMLTKNVEIKKQLSYILDFVLNLNINI